MPRELKSLVACFFNSNQLKQSADNLACLEWTLKDEHLARLDAVSQIELGFPHDFLQTQQIKNIFYGGMFDAINMRAQGEKAAKSSERKDYVSNTV